jgi:hypothetical protein
VILNRREVLRASALGGAAFIFRPRVGWAYGQSPLNLRKFIQPLPALGPLGIPVAVPNTQSRPGTDSYVFEAGEYRQSFHPDLPEARLWGYADITAGQAPNHRYLGGVIVAQKDGAESTSSDAPPAGRHVADGR